MYYDNPLNLIGDTLAHASWAEIIYLMTFLHGTWNREYTVYSDGNERMCWKGDGITMMADPGRGWHERKVCWTQFIFNTTQTN